MSLGLLDIPGLLLGPIDSALAAIKMPTLLRLLGWGWLSGYAGMWIYRRFSPQQRIAEVRTLLADVHKQLASYDGEFSGLLARAQLARCSWQDTCCCRLLGRPCRFDMRR